MNVKHSSSHSIVQRVRKRWPEQHTALLAATRLLTAGCAFHVIKDLAADRKEAYRNMHACSSPWLLLGIQAIKPWRPTPGSPPVKCCHHKCELREMNKVSGVSEASCKGMGLQHQQDAASAAAPTDLSSACTAAAQSSSPYGTRPCIGG